MSNQDGPLAKLSKLLGLGELAPIAAVKRIEERPVSLNPELLFKMTPSPEQMSDTGIHHLSDLEILDTRKRHRPDIYECCDCGYKFPQEAECPECQSTNMALFMRAPSRSAVRQYAAGREGADREEGLESLDPDWRTRFQGDADRAWDFYNGVEPRPPRPTRTSGLGRPFDAPEVEEAPFDSDLEDSDRA